MLRSYELNLKPVEINLDYDKIKDKSGIWRSKCILDFGIAFLLLTTVNRIYGLETR